MKIASGFGPGLPGLFGRSRMNGLMKNFLRGLEGTGHPTAPATGESAPGTERTVLDFRQVHARQASSAVIEIVTSEGDRVTISGESEMDVTYGRLRASTGSPDGWTEANLRFFDISSQDEFSMSVDGHLNEQELKDIGKLMKKIRPMLESMARGGGPRRIGVNPNGFESLAGFRLDVSRRFELTHVQVTRVIEGLPEIEDDGRVPELPPVEVFVRDED